mgnify:CR=1 FL=1
MIHRIGMAFDRCMRHGPFEIGAGNLVAGGTAMSTTLLATIVSLDPLRFEFTFAEAWDKELPHAGRAERAHRMIATVPVVKITDD